MCQRLQSPSSTRAWVRRTRLSPGWKRPMRSAHLRWLGSKWSQGGIAFARIRDSQTCCGGWDSSSDHESTKTVLVNQLSEPEAQPHLHLSIRRSRPGNGPSLRRSDGGVRSAEVRGIREIEELPA